MGKLWPVVEETRRFGEARRRELIGEGVRGGRREGSFDEFSVELIRNLPATTHRVVSLAHDPRHLSCSFGEESRISNFLPPLRRLLGSRCSATKSTDSSAKSLSTSVPI